MCILDSVRTSSVRYTHKQGLFSETFDEIYSVFIRYFDNRHTYTHKLGQKHCCPCLPLDKNKNKNPQKQHLTTTAIYHCLNCLNASAKVSTKTSSNKNTNTHVCSESQPQIKRRNVFYLPWGFYLRPGWKHHILNMRVCSSSNISQLELSWTPDFTESRPLEVWDIIYCSNYLFFSVSLPKTIVLIML